MKIIKQTRLSDGTEVSLALEDSTCWQGFVLKGLPTQHRQHESKPHSLSSAVTIWNRVVDAADRLTVSEISAKIRGSGRQH